MEAFKALPDDNKEVAAVYQKRNKVELKHPRGRRHSTFTS